LLSGIGFCIFQYIEEIAAVNLPKAGIYGSLLVTRRVGLNKKPPEGGSLSNIQLDQRGG
jgi:hypothetical protein